MIFHLARKERDRGGAEDERVARDPQRVGEKSRKLAVQKPLFEFDRMHERQEIRDLFKRGNKFEIEPTARQPRRQICAERAA